MAELIAPSKVNKPTESTVSEPAHNPSPAPQPTYQQQCTGCAQAQGPGAQATYNQFGIQPRKLSNPEDLSTCLSAVHGKLTISAAMNDGESNTYAGQWLDIFDKAKWDTSGIDQAVVMDNVTHQVWRGMSIRMRGELVNGRFTTDDPVAQKVADCVIHTPTVEKKSGMLADPSGTSGMVIIQVGLDSRQ